MFCNTVWNGLHILPYGDIRLCSIGANSDSSLDMSTARDRDGNIMNILTHSIKDIMNSDKHCQVRKVNMNNASDWSPHCACCENREVVTNFDRKHKNLSRRIYLMKIPTLDTATELNFLSKADIDGNVDWYPASLDIRFGNLCNQKCIMCSPDYSNLWYEDWEAWSEKSISKFGNGREVSIIKNERNKWIQPQELQWYEDPRWWPKFEEMMPYLKHIYITGGEPMVAPAHDIMLDKLIESGYAKNIILEYDTNGSVVNDKLAQRWLQFKGVDIRISMDAIEDQYEIIRSGGKWEKFSKNVLRLKEYEKTSNGIIKIGAITSCFQISTAHSILQSEEWCKSVGIQFHIRFLEGPAWHRVLHLPIEARNELLDIYKDSPSEKAKMITNFLRNNENITWSDSANIKTFIRFMNLLDDRRNTKWRIVFPQLSDMLDRHIEQ